MAEYKPYLDAENECYECNGIRCGSCLDCDCYDTDKHPFYENDYENGMLKRKKQTNADCIRAMSDEELAKNRIDRIDMYTSSDLKEYIGDFDGIVNSEEEAIEKELKWLQSEVEG